jgi:hypothetical protein
MKKNKLLEDIINSSLCGQLNIMFGNGSYVEVGYLNYVQSKKKYVAHVKIYMANIEDGLLFYPEGLENLVNIGWKVIERKYPLMTLPSVDIKD